MFISQAMAQASEAAAQAAPVAQTTGTIFQLVLIVAIVYFILIRPQQKRIKKHEAELNSIIKGTQVVVGGFVGRVIAVQDKDKLIVELAKGVEVVVMRPYVSQVLFESQVSKTKG